MEYIRNNIISKSKLLNEILEEYDNCKINEDTSEQFEFIDADNAYDLEKLIKKYLYENNIDISKVMKNKSLFKALVLELKKNNVKNIDIINYFHISKTWFYSMKK